jgi:hypothetical protein
MFVEQVARDAVLLALRDVAVGTELNITESGST